MAPPRVIDDTNQRRTSMNQQQNFEPMSILPAAYPRDSHPKIRPMTSQPKDSGALLFRRNIAAGLAQRMSGPIDQILSIHFISILCVCGVLAEGNLHSACRQHCRDHGTACEPSFKAARIAQGADRR
jgi:hypothetical protein